MRLEGETWRWVGVGLKWDLNKTQMGHHGDSNETDKGLKSDHLPEDMEIKTAITVLIHSYNKDMAEVLWIKLVKGSINFLPNLGSKGVRAPNNLMILINIQLFCEVVINLKKVGAKLK